MRCNWSRRNVGNRPSTFAIKPPGVHRLWPSLTTTWSWRAFASPAPQRLINGRSLFNRDLQRGRRAARLDFRPCDRPGHLLRPSKVGNARSRNDSAAFAKSTLAGPILYCASRSVANRAAEWWDLICSALKVYGRTQSMNRSRPVTACP